MGRGFAKGVEGRGGVVQGHGEHVHPRGECMGWGGGLKRGSRGGGGV